MNEIGYRLGLDHTQVRHLTEDEVVRSLKDQVSIDPRFIDERIVNSVYRYKSGKVTVSTGANADREFSIVYQSFPNYTPSIVNGTCGQPGKATGRVRQVLTVDDMGTFRKGEVLVAFMTDVGIVPAMRRASAIITDVGGVTCHAAIVAREFGIPCVIGTRDGTSALKDGYLVDVDADKGLIKILDRQYPSSDNDADTDSRDEIPISATNWHPLPRPSEYSMKIETFPGQRQLSDASIGGKASSLRNLCALGFSVPPGFVLPSEVFLEFVHLSGTAGKIYESLSQIVDGPSLQKHSRKIREMIIEGSIESEMELLLMEHFSCLSSPLVAVRSSASMEDSVEASWAGQLETFLNTNHSKLIENIKRCWASRFSERALTYGLDFEGAQPQFSTAVVIQKMVNSRIAGTAFSIFPNDKSGCSLVVESCLGLGELLVSGRVTPVTYILDRNTLGTIEILGQYEQNVALLPSSSEGGNRLVELTDAEREKAQLLPSEVKEIASTVMNIERVLGFPVDVEWAIEGHQLYIVQSRPITRI